MAMDELTAHLDRGWDLVQKGDLRGARAAARRALENDKESPEARNLMGYVEAQDGNADEALEHYRQAMALDDGYIDPMLNAAEVLIHPMHEWDEAIALCDEVLEFVEGKEETTDALLLKFDALLGKGDRDGAKAVLARLPDEPFEGPMYPFLIGRALYEVGEIEKAYPNLQKAVANDPQNPDAHYYLGLVADEKDDVRAATLSFLESREIDLAAERPAWAPSKDVFQRAIQKALAQIEPSLAVQMNDAIVLVADAPGMEAVAGGVDPRTPVLLDGVTRSSEPGPLAARVFVYQRNVERLCAGIEQLDEEIAFQLTEEIKHTLDHRDDGDGPDGKPVPRTAAGGRERDRERERERTDKAAEGSTEDAKGKTPRPGKA